jgi:hypothetical protein
MKQVINSYDLTLNPTIIAGILSDSTQDNDPIILEPSFQIPPFPDVSPIPLHR